MKSEIQSPPSEPRTAIGVVERIVYYNADNHFCIAEFRPDKSRDLVSIKGNLPHVQCGETLKVTGHWKRDPNHGLQFIVASHESKLPSSLHGLKRYLGSGLIPGIGPKNAELIVDAFGLETLKVINDESARLRDVKGIGPKKAKAIKASWDEHRAYRDVFLFLQTYGVPPGLCARLVRHFGSPAGEILRNDPYRAAREVPGIGFRTADRIAVNLGLPNESSKRIQAGLVFALEDLSEDGHTASTTETLCAHAAELLQISPEACARELPELLKTRQITPGPPSTELVQLPQLAASEQKIADKLRTLLAVPSGLPPIKLGPAVAWAQTQAGFTFAPEQAAGVEAALRSKVSLLTGGPGTGKTTILRALVAILQAKQVRVLLAAPTGRASQRLAAAAGAFAQTLHRLLRFDPAQGRFTADETSPLACDFCVVDEASMLDAPLAAALFRSLPASAHLLLVGDTAQLPSVGPGHILHDLIECGLCPVTRLNQVFRQQEHSGIVTAAHAILEGQAAPPFGVAKTLAELDPRRDFHFISAPDPEACVNAVVELCSTWIPKHYPKFNPVADVQVLAPMRKGVAGIINLNQRLQQALNPAAPAAGTGGARLAVGDKVLQTRNNYDKNIFNGDLGKVTRVSPDGSSLSADFGNGEQEFDRADLPDVTLAYAATVHKAQGSEFPVVILPLVKAHFTLLQRNLLYTGVTRGRKKVFVVGDPSAYAMAVRAAETTQRVTGLPGWLKVPQRTTW